MENTPKAGKLVSRIQFSTARKWIKVSDLVVLVGLCLLLPVAAIVPRAIFVRACNLAANMMPSGYFHRTTADKIAAGMDITPDAAQKIMRKTMAARFNSILTLLSSSVFGPRFDIAVSGTENIDNALAQGNGVILWIADLANSGDACKIALADKDFQVSHLSRPEHGFSDTRFGLAVLNPFRQRFELRFLRERIVYQRENPNSAGEAILKRLSENGIVSISASGYEGRALVQADFLGGRTQLAGGAPRLAFKGNCPLLPVYSYPSTDGISYEVIVAAPLMMTRDNKDQFILETTGNFLKRLTPIVKSRPELWRAWPHFTPTQNSDAPLDTAINQSTS
jgi:lauroyl/myristoyl acyltransferase